MQSHMAKLIVLTKNVIPLTEREMGVLAVSVCEMVQAGLDPYNERFIIEVEALIF